MTTRSTPDARAFGRMEGKLDLILSRLDTQTKDIEKVEMKIDAHDARLKTVEGRQHYWMGGAAALGAVGAYIAKAWPFGGG